MSEKKTREAVERTLEILNERFLDVNGDMIPLEVIVDKLLKSDEDSDKRRYAEG